MSLLTWAGTAAIVYAFLRWMVPDLITCWIDTLEVIDTARGERERVRRLRAIQLDGEMAQARAQGERGGMGIMVVGGRGQGRES